MFNKLQNTRKINGVLESPNALKIEKGVKYAETAISPPIKIYIYVNASGKRDCGVFNKSKIGFVVTIAIKVITIAINIQVQLPFAIDAAVPFSFFAPKYCETTTPVPIAAPIHMDINVIDNAFVAPIAEKAVSPTNLPTIILSANVYIC